RSGDAAVATPARSGDLVLMRAPGLRGAGPRPFHLLRNVTRCRRTVGLRYDVEMTRYEENLLEIRVVLTP
ncbi:MAG: hypothetical protein NZ789_16875, partial [Pseudomonadales bacterium]|nr:hypothetical protein [Pseudomonadales bacterium]